MYLQAATYNNSLQKLAEMLNEWKEDNEQYSERIAETEKQGKPTAGMEIYYKKQIKKINAIENALCSADIYIQQLLEELEDTKQRTNETIQQRGFVNVEERIRICDLPHSQEYYHEELLTHLFEIKETLNTITNGKEKR